MSSRSASTAPRRSLAGRIAAFTGFIPDEGVTLQAGGDPITAFALDRNGGPSYPGLVAFTTRGLIASDPGLVRDFVTATVHGYEDTLADPARSLNELLAANPTLAPAPDARVAERLPAAVRRWRRVGPVRDVAAAQRRGDVQLDARHGFDPHPDRPCALRHESVPAGGWLRRAPRAAACRHARLRARRKRTTTHPHRNPKGTHR